LIDTHAHLQWPDFDKDREQVIKRAFTAGVSTIVNIGYDLNASREAVRIAEDHQDVYAVVGIHPHNAKTVEVDVLEKLRELAHGAKVVAIGERSDLTTTGICPLAVDKRRHSSSRSVSPKN